MCPEAYGEVELSPAMFPDGFIELMPSQKYRHHVFDVPADKQSLQPSVTAFTIWANRRRIAAVGGHACGFAADGSHFSPSGAE
jgi:hypothetical protein